jgi:hypothetical protein
MFSCAHPHGSASIAALAGGGVKMRPPKTQKPWKMNSVIFIIRRFGFYFCLDGEFAGRTIWHNPRGS